MGEGSIVTLVLPYLLALVMAGMGMTLRPEDFFRVWENREKMVVILIAQLVFLPVCGLLLLLCLKDQPALALGLVLLSACPGGTTSNLFSHLARANVALSISLTSVAGIITVLTIPLWVNIALWLLADSGSGWSLPFVDTLQSLVIYTLLPVLVGMQIKWHWPRFALAAEKPFSQFALLFMVLLTVGLILSQGAEFIVFVKQVGAYVLLLNTAAIAIGAAVAYAYRFDRADTATAIIEVGIQNSAMAIVIATSLIKSEAVAVPAAVYSLTMYLFGFVVVLLHKHKIKGGAGQLPCSID
ncbi:bile acid:sodium symporter family protein [Simiduia litorea]